MYNKTALIVFSEGSRIQQGSRMQILEDEEYTAKNVLKSNSDIKHIHSALYFVICNSL